ncbi:MAG: uracil-DNA glycosylase [Candidatus Kerfeldbacteria bacterium]|nr:uracil-DNA glycosylase [Candidatus Kerfeldbacteria bacterium]
MPSTTGRFLDRLARVPSGRNFFNQYAAGNKHNVIRRRNLQLYFGEVERFSPKTLLLGEAPGYQGSRLTGVPFMSEDILLSGVQPLSMFGQKKGYRKTKEFTRVHKEPTATIVWSTLAQFRFVPLLWSAFPFHPFQPGRVQSNRAPNQREVELGKDFFQELMDIFRIKNVVAVGNVAHQTLAAVGMETVKLRHPSHGGKTEFVRGLARLRQQSKGAYSRSG